MSKKEAAFHYRAMGEKARPAGGVMLLFPDVIRRVGWSRTTIWRKVRAGEFPPPLSLGKNSVGWPSVFIDDWIASRPQVNYAPASSDGAVIDGGRK